MTTPTDPLFSSQWHFPLIGDIQTIWDEYTGNGVNVGVYDDGVQSTHNDLDGNYDASLEVVDDNGQVIDADPNLTNNDSHGTSVAGIIAAESGNGEGGVGVAYGSTITGVNIFDEDTYGFVNDTTSQGFQEFLDVISQATNFDIMSNSWGATPLFRSRQSADDFSNAQFLNEYALLSANGRAGLGTIITQAAGNDNYDANGDATNASRHTITVGATDESGDVADFSNYGSSILISAPAAAVTTDLIGNNGYNAFGSSDGDSLSDTDYTSTFGGTSAATPVVSGVIALMLEANSELGWRDVQNILATSASHTGSDFGSSASGFEVEAWDSNSAGNWNGGGMTFNGSYGYGMIDAFASVRNAEAWQYLYDTPLTSANEVSGMSSSASFRGGFDIPDGNSTGLSFGITSNVNLDIEHITLNMNFTHSWVGDLTIFLTDPNGNEMQVLFRDTGFGPSTTHTGTWSFGIDSFLGVNSFGTWTVRVVDNANGLSGTIFDAELEFFGAAPTTDDVYNYTQDVFDFVAVETDRLELSDTNGGEDWVNLAPFAEDLAVNLATDGSGSLGTLANGAIFANIDGGTVIENVITGDGNDTVIGNDANNELLGMRGNDTIAGGLGNDTIDAGEGNDTVIAGLSDGDDTYTGGSGFDVLDFSQVQGVVQVNQLGGVITGSAGNDTLNDVFEQVIGSNFDDVLSGGNGGDVLDGNDGNDQFFANGGDDLVRGGEGNDTFFFSTNDGNDRLEGGAGFDVLDYSSLQGVVQVNQLDGTTTGTANNDILLDVFEQVIGSNFGDVLSGGNGINVLNGGGGDDQLFANGGSDQVSGGAGNDTITMGFGDDRLDFRNGDETDTITDFNAGAGSEDQIILTFHSAATSFAQMQSAGMFSQQGADTHINLGGGDLIVLQNVMVGALHQDDFIF